jgi:hypothetical protein
VSKAPHKESATVDVSWRPTGTILTKAAAGVAMTVFVAALAALGWRATHQEPPVPLFAVAPNETAEDAEEEDDDDSAAAAQTDTTSGLPEIPLAPHATPPRSIPRANKHRPPHAKKVVDPMPPPLMAPAPAQSTPHVCSVADELALLRPAQVAISDGRADKALQLLAAHRHECPTGTMAEERDAAWVLALCAAHSDEEALHAAQQLVQANPQSRHLARLSGSCAQEALKQ